MSKLIKLNFYLHYPYTRRKSKSRGRHTSKKLCHRYKLSLISRFTNEVFSIIPNYAPTTWKVGLSTSSGMYGLVLPDGDIIGIYVNEYEEIKKYS